jgi:hypothetical protein
MKRVVTDDYLRERLLGFRQPLNLCDESGRIVARFVPAGPQLREEERQCRERATDYPTPDLVAYPKKQE